MSAANTPVTPPGSGPAAKPAPPRSRPTVSPKRREQSRREFIRTSVLGVGVLGATLAGLIPLATQAQARLRPPGAIKDRLEERISSPLASSAANASRSARWRPSTSPT